MHVNTLENSRHNLDFSIRNKKGERAPLLGATYKKQRLVLAMGRERRINRPIALDFGIQANYAES